MKKPVIGIVTNVAYKEGRKYATNAIYVKSVADAGGIPVLLPAYGLDRAQAEDYIDLLDGILFAGGEDLCSYTFGEDPHPAVTYIAVERDALELGLAKLADERHMPMYGICRGMQLINTAFGGTLYQDLPTQKPQGLLCHRQDMAIRNVLTHVVDVVEGTFCERFGKEPLFVNSFHHQAVKEMAPGFTAAAYAPDGVLEAFESQEHHAKAVQWHPEELWIDHPRFAVFFKDLVEEAKEFAARK